MPGHVYHFAVRAVDTKSRLGPFSEPRSIKLDKKWSLPLSTSTSPKTALNPTSLPKSKSPHSPKVTMVLPDDSKWNGLQTFKWRCSLQQMICVGFYQSRCHICYHWSASCACTACVHEMVASYSGQCIYYVSIIRCLLSCPFVVHCNITLLPNPESLWRTPCAAGRIVSCDREVSGVIFYIRAFGIAIIIAVTINIFTLPLSSHWGMVNGYFFMYKSRESIAHILFLCFSLLHYISHEDRFFYVGVHLSVIH